MGTLTGKVCRERGCPVLIDHPAILCPEHLTDTKQGIDRRRGSASSRGYGSRWRRVRERFLKANQLCTLCGLPSTVADHYPTPRRELVAMGAGDVDAPHRLRALCKGCHDAETKRREGGHY